MRRGSAIGFALGLWLVAAGCGSDGGSRADRATSSAPGTSEAATTTAAVNTTGKPRSTAGRSLTVDTSTRHFVTPSGNIACVIEPETVRCDVRQHDWSPPPKPADCDLDYGDSVALDRSGPRFGCHGDTLFGAQTTVPYGTQLRQGSISCDVTEEGVTCRDAQTRQGFSVSRASYRFF